MTPDPIAPDLARVQTEVINRLQALGVATTALDTTDDLARLLDAVEEFERTVQQRGGDLMLDEPIASKQAEPIRPDNGFFVIPAREENETAAAFIERIKDARARASRVWPRNGA
jgi:hypothetical protein